MKARGEVNEVYFVACGGSQAVLMAGQYLFDRESNVPSHVYTANEFVYDTPKNLCERSLVISCSHSGNTPETIAATKLAREKGAMTIALSILKDLNFGKQQNFLFTMIGVKMLAILTRTKEFYMACYLTY